jgi:hypothetical protein
MFSFSQARRRLQRDGYRAPIIGFVSVNEIVNLHVGFSINNNLNMDMDMDMDMDADMNTDILATDQTASKKRPARP